VNEIRDFTRNACLQAGISPTTACPEPRSARLVESELVSHAVRDAIVFNIWTSSADTPTVASPSPPSTAGCRFPFHPRTSTGAGQLGMRLYRVDHHKRIDLASPGGPLLPSHGHVRVRDDFSRPKHQFTRSGVLAGSDCTRPRIAGRELENRTSSAVWSFASD
jgi:hypothetical protein